jgi:hypothetical protein
VANPKKKSAHAKLQTTTNVFESKNPGTVELSSVRTAVTVTFPKVLAESRRYAFLSVQILSP